MRSSSPFVRVRASRFEAASARPTRGWLGKAIAAAIVLTTLSLSAGLASAQHGSWLVPHLTSFYLEPSPARDDLPTTMVLWGWFPYACGQVVDASVVDPSHVELTLRPGPPSCSDTVRTWHQPFALGLLPAGYQPMHVKIRFVDESQNEQVDEGEFSFEVIDADAPPPPPPPPSDPPSWLFRGLTGYSLTPSPPNNLQPTTLVLFGWTPAECFGVTEPTVVDPGHVAFALGPIGACDDTARTWAQAFDLGVLAAGEHAVRIDMTVTGDIGDSTEAVIIRTGTFSFGVLDGLAPPPPPPPPPADSLVSQSRPNPFRAVTRFAVHMDAEAQADVAIYDLAGREVIRMWNGVLAAGSREFAWDGHRADGTRAPGGIYFTRVASQGRVETRRIVLLSTP